MNLHSIDIAVLVAYMGIVLGMGVYFSRRNNNTEEYFLGGRSFSGWVIGLSLVGTSISSITFIAYPADAYKTAWLRYLPNLMLPLAVFLAAKWFLPRFRANNAVSAYEFLEDRFGPSVRVYGAGLFIFSQLVRISTILYLLALLIHELTGLPPITAIIIGGVFVAIYTIIGGIDAVIWTDVMQTIVLVLGGLFCLWIIIDALPGGFTQVVDVATRDGKLGFSAWANGELKPVSWDLSLLNKTGTMMLLLGLTTWLTEYSSNQNTVQRFCAAKSTAEAKKGLWVVAFASLPIWAFYMFLGTCLYVFYQVFPSPIPAAILDGSVKAEQIMPYFITHHLPVGAVGLVISAALAAAMSSLDSSVNAITTVGISDIYRRHLAPDREDKHYLRVAWGLAAVVSTFMIFGAIWIQQAETVTLQDTMTIAVSLLSGGLLGLYLFAFFVKQGDAKAVWIGVAATAAFTAWTLLAKNGLLPESISVPFDLYYAGIIGNIVMFVAVFLAASLFSRRAKPVE